MGGGQQDIGKAAIESGPKLSPRKAWVALVGLSIRRQARMRYMIGIALALLALTIICVCAVSVLESWKLTDRRPWGWQFTYRQSLYRAERFRQVHARVEPSAAIQDAVIASAGAALEHSAFLVFSRYVVFAVFQSFLLPLWTLSFSADALGNERESRTLIWLLTRPLPRPAIYLAKYVAALPWCLGLNLLGFAGICLSAGEPGQLALRLFWPAVLAGSVAFAALFHMLAALVRRPAIVGLVYSFFFEALVGDLPGDLKRASLSFYVRSLMFDATHEFGLDPEQLTVYNPVSAGTAWLILIGATVVFTLIGAIVFSRAEYREDI